jgi:hypothetical protein
MQQNYAAAAVCKTEFGNKVEAHALRSSGLNAIPSPKRPWKSRSGDTESDMVISETPNTDTEELNLPFFQLTPCR